MFSCSSSWCSLARRAWVTTAGRPSTARCLDATRMSVRSGEECAAAGRAVFFKGRTRVLPPRTEVGAAVDAVDVATITRAAAAANRARDILAPELETWWGS